MGCCIAECPTFGHGQITHPYRRNPHRQFAGDLFQYGNSEQRQEKYIILPWSLTQVFLGKAVYTIEVISSDISKRRYGKAERLDLRYSCKRGIT